MRRSLLFIALIAASVLIPWVSLKEKDDQPHQKPATHPSETSRRHPNNTQRANRRLQESNFKRLFSFKERYDELQHQLSRLEEIKQYKSDSGEVIGLHTVLSREKPISESTVLEFAQLNEEAHALINTLSAAEIIKALDNIGRNHSWKFDLIDRLAQTEGEAGIRALEQLWNGLGQSDADDYFRQWISVDWRTAENFGKHYAEESEYFRWELGEWVLRAKLKDDPSEVSDSLIASTFNFSPDRSTARWHFVGQSEERGKVLHLLENQSDYAKGTFWHGWAMSDPQAADQWWKAQGSEPPKFETGIVMNTNPEKLEAWLSENRFGQRLKCLQLTFPTFPKETMKMISKIPSVDERLAIYQGIQEGIFIPGHSFGLIRLVHYKRQVESDPQLTEPQRTELLKHVVEFNWTD